MAVGSSSHTFGSSDTVDDRRSPAMHPTALLFMTLAERKNLAEVEAREHEYRLVRATAKREAREARRLAKTAGHATRVFGPDRSPGLSPTALRADATVPGCHDRVDRADRTGRDFERRIRGNRSFAGCRPRSGCLGSGWTTNRDHGDPSHATRSVLLPESRTTRPPGQARRTVARASKADGRGQA